MAFQLSRTDTGQFVLIDPVTDTAVIDDDLAAGFAKIERATAGKPPVVVPRPEPPTSGSSVFAFTGGPRYLAVLLAVLLPFLWLGVLYLALANLLSEHSLDREAAKQTQTRLQELEREVQALRSELSGAPRTAKTKPTPRDPKSKPTRTAEPESTGPPSAENTDNTDGSEDPR